ncbi:MAG TPA: type III pantothenate kinase [Nitratifractor sp.]|nr:type III pantothenate kinase [Nitratifractor sp.]
MHEPLVDIGNRYAHLYLDGKVFDLSYDELFAQFSHRKIFYICVNNSLRDLLSQNSLWIDIEPFIEIKGSYRGMGIDRQVVLLSRGDGIYIDAGSAITIDKIVEDEYQGGIILPGVWSMIKSYAQISPILEIESLDRVDLCKLPKSNTRNTISYGIIAPIVAFVEKINSEGLPIYCCGGDGERVSGYMQSAIYSKELVFEGMNKVVKECGC